MSQLKIIGILGIAFIFISSLVSGQNIAYQIAGIGIGGSVLAFATFMMFCEIHETITSKEE
ncbi:MAG: hypothetical protein M0Q91_13250 [Methanoregula sp.]|jgi:small-conductance mechanosensitive channel|nr:hypothetical protein [Methanoregula sp.]